MLKLGEAAEANGKEPLLADETVPLTFLESPEDAAPASKLAVRTMAAVIALIIVVAVGLGVANRSQDWDPALAPFVEFVETERGLPFLHTVPVSAIDLADFNPPRAARFFEPERDPALTTAFRLLGVDDFDQAEDGFITDLVDNRGITDRASSYKRDAQGRIFLTKEVPIAALQLDIVHALTLALLDQHSLIVAEFDDVDQFAMLDESDERRVLDALVVGDATRIEHAFYDQMTDEQRAEYHEALGSDLEGVRHPADSSDRFTIGAPFTQLIVETEGVEALNSLLRSRTGASTDRFVDVLGNDASTVDAFAEIDLPESVPEADGDFGAFGWFVTLAPLVGVEDAFDAVIGYSDDAFAIFENTAVQRTSPLRTCIRSDVFFDGAEEARQFAEIVGQLGVEGEVSDVRQSVTMDICQRLAEQGQPNPAVNFPLIVANEMALHHLQAGEGQDVARCAAIAQARTVPIDYPLETFAGYSVYVVESVQFLDQCR